MRNKKTDILNKTVAPKGKFKATAHADGSITVGWVSGQKKVYVSDERYEEARTLKPIAITYYDAETRLTESVETLSKEQAELLGLDGSRLLGSSVPAILNNNEKRTRARKCQYGITSYGRRVVRCGATLLEERFGKGGLAFLTLTPPALSDEGKMLYAAYWGSICKAFRQALRRHFKHAQVQLHYVEVTEVQGKRASAEGWLPLHLHAIFNSKSGGRYIVSADWLRATWARLVGYYTTEEVNCSAAVDIQPVKKSAANYLSKYISKGKDELAKFDDTIWQEFLPTKWWYVSTDLKNEVKEVQTTLPEADAETIANHGAKLVEQGVLAYHYDIVTTLKDGAQRVMGAVAQMHGTLKTGLHTFMHRLKSAIIDTYTEDCTYDYQMVAT